MPVDTAPDEQDGGDRQSEAPRELHYEREDDHRAQAEAAQAQWIAETLGGAWQRDGAGVCLVVDRLLPGDRPHGHCEIGVHAEAVRRYQQTLFRLDTPGPRPREDDGLFSDFRFVGPSDFRAPSISRLLFFDLETTGLSGGAGTCAFLIGYGWFEGDGFRTRQYFLAGYGHEAALLRMAVGPLNDDTAALVSFNGKTFDVPLIQGRYLFHRLSSPFDAAPHVDLLHPARRLWRYRSAIPDGTSSRRGTIDGSREEAIGRYLRASGLRQQYRQAWDAASAGSHASPAEGRFPNGARRAVEMGAVAASCALGVLEQDILGFHRAGDVPGAEIPARYFHYARTGDVRPLERVLEHNRYDLVSLAALASVIARMVEEGPRAARTAHECLALGRLYERTGSGERAAECYQRILDEDADRAWRADGGLEREALRHLALGHRRARRHQDAADAWQRLLDLATESRTDSGSDVLFEALHGLAVYHEHRSRNLQAARALVMRAIDSTRDPRQQLELRHRLTRIERKMRSVEPAE